MVSHFSNLKKKGKAYLTETILELNILKTFGRTLCRKSKFGIIPRHARREEEIIWFEAKAGFVFHTVNAWEEGDEIILVACRSKATSSLGLTKGRPNAYSHS